MDNRGSKEKLTKIITEKPELLQNLNISPHKLFLFVEHLENNNVVVREKSEWVKEGPYTSIGGEYKKALLCPQCDSFFVSDGDKPWQLHNFCPNCGVDMRKGKNDD